jgi:DNA helicase TIP49, TBP-interacting protein
LIPYANETEPEWLYFLDEEQARIAESIVDTIEDGLLGGAETAQLLVGGPGTGKTTILMQVLAHLSGLFADSIETWDVRLSIGDELARYITASTNWDLTAARRPVTLDDPADVLLVDDPSTIWEMRQARANLTAGSARALVLAFDPLQLGDSLDDHGYAELRGALDAREWLLSSCYRQKAVVGEAAARVATAVAQSSPFLDEVKKQSYAKQRTRVTELANKFRFVNPSGRVSIDHSRDLGAWRRHFGWIRKQRLWRHWESVLVVVDDDVRLPKLWRDDVADLAVRWSSLSEVQKIKGLEYPHVVLVLTDDRFNAAQNGFTGSGRRVYDDYRLLRIPFSSAKDSIGIFVIGDADDSE